MMIQLTQGMMAEIDIADYYKVMRHEWRALTSSHAVYAYTKINGRDVPMTKLIKSVPDGYTLDHWDKNTLNNRWNNLRPVTPSQNMYNTNQPVGMSGYRGVIRHGYTDKWRARVSADGVLYEDGPFDDPVDAAIARDRLAMQLHGEFAVLNFSVESYK